MSDDFAPRGQKLGRRVAAADQDYQARLDTVDRLLSALMHDAAALRHVVQGALSRLRTGADPGPVRAILEPWELTIREVKLLAREL